MKNNSRIASTASALLLVALLAACAPMSPQNNYPSASYPQGTNSSGIYPASSYPAPNQQSTYVEYGRVSNVEVLQSQGQSQPSGVGAIIGGIAGAVVGSQIGGGSGRSAATVVGGLGGAVAGNAIEKSRGGNVTETFRISVQMDNGSYRSYDLPASGQLRTGDRVRIENGQLFRM
ncbi:MAG: glycine zipper 2TM domain-containing protein [Polaromonas sp.]|nr:glycine zipper 2TM domain-containing protein [Polaromonas sp.]